MDKRLMAYVPKEYKDDVADIYEARKEWNEITRRWNSLITVEWADGGENTYQNASYMRFVLKEFGRD